MNNTSNTFTSLRKEQKEAVGLLSIGTFLEYFDLMLYVHMTVFLNELFFPEADPHTQTIYAALAFCSTYTLRPVGAIIFGWIGDNIGRKSTIIITTFMMAASCIIMANLPTYAQIGITATYIVSACRIIQSLSSTGEAVGAEIYLTEIIKPPAQYPIVTLISVSGVIGEMVALGFASLVTSFGFNWRIAFWFGTIIALVGGIARTSLRETRTFIINTRGQIKNNIKVNKKTILALFFINCVVPIKFYFIYFYCSNILKNSFNYSAEQIIHHNFIISIIAFFTDLIFTYLSYIIYPLKILKIRLIIFSIFIIICPVLLNNVTIPLHLLLIQSIILFIAPTEDTAVPIFYSHFPVLKRFSYTSIIFALSRMLIYIITSFLIIYLTDYFHHWGLLIIIFPIIIGFTFGLFHFEKLEKESGHHTIKITDTHQVNTMV